MTLYAVSGSDTEDTLTVDQSVAVILLAGSIMFEMRAKIASSEKSLRDLQAKYSQLLTYYRRIENKLFENREMNVLDNNIREYVKRIDCSF